MSICLWMTEVAFDFLSIDSGVCGRMRNDPGSRNLDLKKSNTPEPTMSRRIPVSAFRGALRPRPDAQFKFPWVCQSCRTNSQPRASFSGSRSSLEKPYYITTPIFYVNAGKMVLFRVGTVANCASRSSSCWPSIHNGPHGHP